ncbi:MAG: V-type ATP synthase subunit F [Longimicrobiales bacterium]|nr:V-type ATP synthase subunit F [Longimicrobiales bacterium]
MRVGVICDPFVALGFRLAGLNPAEASDPEHARRRLAEMLEHPSWGVVLVQEDLIPDPASVGRGPDRSDLPLLIPFPGPELERGPGEAEEYVTELLRRAIGYRVRLR